MKTPTASAHIAIIGGGPAGLMAAEIAAREGVRVTVYDRMPTMGRKFLLAGRGGLNLTHNEPLESFLGRYGAAVPSLRAAIEAFPPERLREWCEGLGQPTFVGSSGRVFPVAMKATPCLRAWLRSLAACGVEFKPRHRWEGWRADGVLRFATPEGGVDAHADAVILALGGASWPRMGSDGSWTALLAEAGVAISPLKPANCGFLVAWSEMFRERFHGQPLKGIALSFEGRIVRGEALITREGLLGGAVYALSAALRDAIERQREAGAVLHFDLRPGQTVEALAARLQRPRGKASLANFLRKAAKLSPLETGILQEAALDLPGQLAAMSPQALAAFIKAVPVRLTAPASIERAISTAGGVMFDALDEAVMLCARPGVFASGEMLDWEAPTGGYLLQACFATGAAAARGALAWLATSDRGC
ncbi:MAG: TIGR03862 family flavoprotein [Alphaproteobacteria bacterium]